MKKTKSKNTRRYVYIYAAAAVCIVSVIVMVAALCIPKTERGSFVPPPFDDNAIMGTPTVPEGMGWQEIDAGGFRASICGHILPDGNTADVWLTNPADNTVWLRLRVLDEGGNIIGESGLIRPGEYLRSVTLSRVPKTGSKISLKLMAYQPGTYYSEGAVTLDTTIIADCKTSFYNR